MKWSTVYSRSEGLWQGFKLRCVMVRYLPGLLGLPREIRTPIKLAFRGLKSEYHFRVFKSHYDPKTFGNIVIGLRSGKFEIDVIRDRSQFLHSLVWNKRRILFDDLTSITSIPNIDLNEEFISGINQLVDIINKHWETIVSLFEPDSLATTLSQITELQVKRVMLFTDWDYSKAKDYVLNKPAVLYLSKNDTRL